MKIITKTAAENSAYPPLQDWPNLVQPDGYYKWPDSLETETFYQYNGFVVLTIQRGIVTAYEPNTEAWEAWKASMPPEPEPQPSETQLLGQEITDLQLSDIEQGQYATELDLRIREMEGSTDV